MLKRAALSRMEDAPARFLEQVEFFHTVRECRRLLANTRPWGRESGECRAMAEDDGVLTPCLASIL